MSEIGWRFPSADDGAEAGFNDSGIETYAGRPFENLAREIIQNSLDARKSMDLPVTVSFELEEIRAADFPSKSDLLAIMKKCKKASRSDEDADAEIFLRMLPPFSTNRR